MKAFNDGAMLVTIFALSGCSSLGSAIALSAAAPTDVSTGYRIVAPAAVTDVTHAQMVAQLSRADVVFFGEQHDDPETHRAEAEVLEAIGRAGRPVVLSLEMFERDVQGVLDDYLAGRIDEKDFLARSRPWDRYATDYRRMVELAKERRWSVVAANVPRSLASAVGRKGLAAFDTLTPKERTYAASENVCPNDDYRARFLESMQSHSPGAPSSVAAPAPRAAPVAEAPAAPAATATAMPAAPRAATSGGLPPAMAERFYVAQCVKDEAMAEAIVTARLAAPRNAIVVHYDGAFHSDYSQGTVSRVKRRRPGWTLAVITAIPVADPAAAPIAPQRGKADFVIFTRRPERRP